MIAKVLVIGAALTFVAQTAYKYQDLVPERVYDFGMVLLIVYWLSGLRP